MVNGSGRGGHRRTRICLCQRDSNRSSIGSSKLMLKLMLIMMIEMLMMRVLMLMLMVLMVMMIVKIMRILLHVIRRWIEMT